MSNSRFTHLHLHTEYSLLDGGNRIDRLIEQVKAMGMDTVAVTDHGNLHAAVEFYKAAKKAKIKPILGIEAYVAAGDRRHRIRTGIQDGGFHLVLLAENNAGWANLMRLSSDAYLNGFYYKPRMDKETLGEWSQGLIAINGHLGSSIAYHLVAFEKTGDSSHWDAAVEEAKWHAETFGTNEDGEPCFYIELQRNDVAEQEAINPHLVNLAKELNLPLVCDNDVHYLTQDDHDTHDTLCCISMSKTKDDPNRLIYSRELYLKSPEDMVGLFHDHPEAIANTQRIATRCDVELDLTTSHAPFVRVKGPTSVPPPPPGDDLAPWFNEYCANFQLLPIEEKDDATIATAKAECDEAMRLLCEAGLIWRYGVDGITDAIRTRCDRELRILADKAISAYFLICWDFVAWARQQGIPASARGSGVGTMVGYVLGLSNACPETYGLLFERFTDPDRSEYPDIDIDICQDGRSRVIDYVRQKYGHVAQIITFGRLKARAAIKDVARVRGLEAIEGQRLANMVPAGPGVTLDGALAQDERFQQEVDSNSTVGDVIDAARSLEGHARHAGIHAAGVVIATQPLETIIPLCKTSNSDDVVTQWDGPTCELVGLLKMDFLGLRTLSTIELCKKNIRQTLDDGAIRAAVGASESDPDPLDLDRISLDDDRVLALFRRSDTVGVFQFESGGMRRLLGEMKPDRIEDLIAANALFRPGPMDLIPDYCARKNGTQAVPTVHDIVDEYTRDTYGIMVYQEQVMQIVHGLGDIPLREAYTLIKAISKKKHRVINAMRPRFVDGAQEKGLDAHRGEELFDLILKFAGYGFNKSHSTSYALTAYQTAYLKTFFPAQYMAAVLTYESGAKKVEDWSTYLEACRLTRRLSVGGEPDTIGLRVEPPDINHSGATFTVVFGDDEPRTAQGGHIRFGLGAIKGAGQSAMEAILDQRNGGGAFTSIFDFCSRVSSRAVNKATLEALIKGGAFDGVHSCEDRAAVHAAIESAMRTGQVEAEDRRAGQMAMFGGGGGEDGPEDDAAPMPKRSLPSVPPWSLMTALAHEKECLGFHVSGHPMDTHADAIAVYASTDAQGAQSLSHDSGVIIGGLISNVRILVTKRGRTAGQRMAIITLQDRHGDIELVAFPETFSKLGDRLIKDTIVLATGIIDTSRGDVQVQLDAVHTLDDASRHLTTRLELDLLDGGDDQLPILARAEMVAGILKQVGGARVGDGRPADVDVRMIQNGELVVMRSKHRVIVDASLLRRLGDELGDDAVRIIGGGGIPTPKPRRSYRRAPAESLA
jgi:DNA polymerase-3 subunit alpha